VPREGGGGAAAGDFFGPEDFQVGQAVTIYGRTFFLVDCDPYTRQAPSMMNKIRDQNFILFEWHTLCCWPGCEHAM